MEGPIPPGFTPPPGSGIELIVHKKKVPLDPPVTVWNLALICGQGEWRESFGTEGEKDAFIKGLRALSSVAGLHGFGPTIRVVET